MSARPGKNTTGHDEAAAARHGWRRTALWGGLVVLLAFGAGGVWALTAPLSSAVVATGTIAVESGRKVVEHPDGGEVTELLVHDGEQVEAGQLLLRLDTTEPRAVFQAARQAVDAALIRRTRLRAERDDRARMRVPDALAERQDAPAVRTRLAEARDRFQARREAFAGRLAVQRRRVEQQTDRVAGLRADRAGVLEQARILRDELAGLRELAEKGFYARSEVRARERKLAGLEGRAGRLKAEIAGAQAVIGETEARIQQIRRSYREEVLSRLRESERDLSQARERLKRTRARLDRRYVLAEFAGTVHDLRIKSAGDVIRRGETVLQLIPTDDPLIVEARVAPRDIDQVDQGQTANVRLTALSQRSTPVLTGRVVRVSADRLQPGDGEAAYYAVRVRIPASELSRLNADQRLRAGMPARVLIQAEPRTLAEYLWKPVGDAMSRGMSEP